VTLPVSGNISIGAVATELGLSAAGLSLNHPWVRALAQVPSGGISMSALYGKTGNWSGSAPFGDAGVGALSVPLFGGQTTEYGQGSAGGLYYPFLDFSTAPPDYTGNFIISCSTTGQSSVLTYTGGGQWGGPAMASPLFTPLVNNTFSIYPHT
jgi:hypothetical protein